MFNTFNMDFLEKIKKMLFPFKFHSELSYCEQVYHYTNNISRLSSKMRVRTQVLTTQGDWNLLTKGGRLFSQNTQGYKNKKN